MAISLKIIGVHWRAIGLFSVLLLVLAPNWVAAGPAGGQIVGGSGSITRPNSNLTEIHQSSDRLAIDWQQFNVNANEVVKFIQPSSHSIALNRILDSKQSLILGRIEANGRIFLINPRGIIFGKDATVNVAGLVASSLDIDPRNFINGNFEFTDKGGEGVIVNQGTIEAAVGGAVVLLGKVVINEGDIRAPRGSAQLVSAGGAVISFDDNQQLGIQITAEQQQKIENQTDAVRNSGTITAQGGYIALTGATTADLFTNAVNNEGVLVANSVRNRNGVIELIGGDGNVAQSGHVDVSAIDASNAGKIVISGNAIHDTGKLTADGANGGDIQLHAQDLILTENNAAISATGSNGKGGHIELLGDRVGVLDNSRIDASGSNGGGVVHIGGAFHGEQHGTNSRNAQRTVVDNGVSIYADAKNSGNGGEVVLWSDDITYFGGNIFARGGANGGDGGNVEVSGKQSLNFTGFVDTSAPHGKMGNLLLDPAIINIVNGSGGADDAQVTDGIINASDNSGGTYQISEQALEALTSNVTLTATQQINIANLADNLLLFNPNGGTVTFNVTATSGTAAFTMADVNDEIRVNNGNLVINGSNSGGGDINFTLGKLATTTAGNITVTASASCAVGFGGCSAGNVTINTGTISSAGTVSVHGDSTGGAAFSGGNFSGGAIALTVGNIAAGGAVTIDTSSTATGGIPFVNTTSSGTTSVTTNDILVSGSGAIQITASSPLNTTSENIFIGGKYLTAGGNITMSGNTLNLNANALIDTSIFGTGGSVSIPTAPNRVLNGHTLTLGVNDIYVGDISGSATINDLGFSQADIDIFAGSGLTLRATGNIFLGNATITGPSATVQLVADRDNNGAGDLSIASGKTFDVNGRNLTASGHNATINGSIVNSGTGSQQITATAAINMGSGAALTSGSGNISLNAGTALTMASDATIASTSGQLSLTAANNIALGSLSTGNATTSAVGVTSTNGSISNAGAVTNISASAAGSRATLSASNGITAALSIGDLSLTNSTGGTVNVTNDRALQISSFTNTPATAASVITTGVGSDMTIAGNASSGSNFALTSSGAFTVNNGSTVNSNAGTLTINATGDAAITGLTTTNNTVNAVSVISSGAITDNGNTNLDITATQANAVVTLQAANGIGAANPLDLAIANLILTNSTSGAVALTNNRALQINSFSNTPATAASIITTGIGSNMIVAGNVASGSNIALTSSGTFSITDGFTVNPTAGTLAIHATGNAAITGLTTTNNTASAISVISGGAITDNGNSALDITAAQPNAVVTLQAANGIGAANALDLSIANLALSNSTSGAVSVTNNQALQINSLTNTPATATTIATTGIGSNMTIAGNISSGGNIALTSSGTFAVNNGSTVNSNAGTLSINATSDAAITGLITTNNTANAVSVISGGAISDSGDINADITAIQPGAVATLQAASGIGNGNAIDINGQIAATNGNSGDIRLHALGSYTFGAIDNSASINGVVALSSDGSLTVNNVTTANGAISLSAADNVLLATGAALRSTAGNISITADTNTNGVGQIAMGSGTINSGTGTIALSAPQDINLNRLTTTNATTSAVSITSTAGKILGNSDGTADITATSAGSRTTLNAASGIDAGSNPLELSVLDLMATNTTSNGINLTNNRTLQISGLTNTPATNTTIAATGVGSDLIFVATLQNGGGNATLTATRNIDLQNIANVAALNTNSAAVNYAQSIAVGSINSTGTATIAGNLTTATGNIDLQTVALGIGAHVFSTSAGNDINLGAITGNSNLQLSSGRNITLASAALGAGNFSATSTANGTFTANGTIGASTVTLNQFSTANLLGVAAGNTLDVTANAINLSGNLSSAGAMTLTGTTQLQNDILLSETGSGGLLQLAGSVIGNAHALTITAGSNTVCIACTAGSSASGLATLDIQNSIKTVLGATSVNGNATINADQEIYLNGDTTIAGNLALLADANNDGIGIAALLTGKQLNVSGTLTTQPIALSSIATPAQCAAPTGLPQMPSSPPPPTTPSPPGQPAFLTQNDVQIAIQESDKYGVAASDAMLRNVSQIAYLGNNCQTDSDTRKNRGQCDVDASMLDFLGTFLIDNQIPKNGSGQ